MKEKREFPVKRPVLFVYIKLHSSNSGKPLRIVNHDPLLPSGKT